MKGKKKTKLQLAQDKAQAAINKTNKTIEALGENTSSLYETLTTIQELFDKIRNVPSDKKLQYEELKQIRLNCADCQLKRSPVPYSAVEL